MTQPGTVAILTYHSLDDEGSVLSTPPRRFAEQMRTLREFNVQVVPLTEVLRLHSLQHTPALAAPVVAITFDDGFQNLYECGFPVLQQYCFPATVFLVTDYCGKINSWPGQPPHVHHRPLLRWSEIREMSSAGLAFGCHTRTHPDLSRLPKAAAEEEMVAARKAIEDGIGRPVESFAYPYGAYDDTVRQLAAAHFDLACSARLGFVTAGSDRFALERLDMYYLRRSELFRRLFSSEMQLYIRFRRGLRAVRRSWSSRRSDREGDI